MHLLLGQDFPDEPVNSVPARQQNGDDNRESRGRYRFVDGQCAQKRCCKKRQLAGDANRR